MPLPGDHSDRLGRARLSLDGLSLGDALGECFFNPRFRDPERLRLRNLPPPVWQWTDDTAMAMGLVEVLRQEGQVEQDKLAEIFSRNFAREPGRGYGGGAMRLLANVAMGRDWRELSPAAFRGQGSMGNGAAMRVAPLGAYFADNLDQAAEQAERSAEVTHWHPEGRAGAVVVAVAAAMAWQMKNDDSRGRPERFLATVVERTPEGPTREGLEAARRLGPEVPIAEAVRRLGNGSRIIAPDTVPFCIWCAARHLDSYVDALWSTIEGFGDVDTTCAIVGGIVSLSTGRSSIPVDWIQAREPLWS